jgi:hypothetical protein
VGTEEYRLRVERRIMFRHNTQTSKTRLNGSTNKSHHSPLSPAVNLRTFHRRRKRKKKNKQLLRAYGANVWHYAPPTYSFRSQRNSQQGSCTSHLPKTTFIHKTVFILKTTTIQLNRIPSKMALRVFNIFAFCGKYEHQDTAQIKPVIIYNPYYETHSKADTTLARQHITTLITVFTAADS